MNKGGVVTQMGCDEISRMLSGANTGLQLIDVRTPIEFESEHIDGSINIPLDELGQRGGEFKKDKAVVLICRTGNRASRAAGLLVPYGFDAALLAGGIQEWKKYRLPLKKGKQRLSLERQVQLTIGLILLSSVGAGWTVSKWFFIMPALIGAGLTFAGLTGNCGLALMLAKAPWNKQEAKADRKSPGQPSCCS
jgi:rhodanese-related sulfurtransferase